MKRTKYIQADLGQIEITTLLADLSQMADLHSGSVYDIIEPPKGQSLNWEKGVWVMGTSKPVLLLFSEFKKVKK